MRCERMYLANVRRAPRSTAAAIVAVVAAVLTSCGSESPARPLDAGQPSPSVSASMSAAASTLYFQAGQTIARLNIEDGTSSRVVDVGTAGVVGIVPTSSRLYWVELSHQKSVGDSIWSVANDGSDKKLLVSNLDVPTDLVRVDGYVYWADLHGLGRVSLDGSKVERRYFKLPRQRGGGTADGLAASDDTLLASYCDPARIERIKLGANPQLTDAMPVPARTCPEEIAAVNDLVYWAALGGGVHSGEFGEIGVLGPNGQELSTALDTRRESGPWSLAADGRYVYWTWGGDAGLPAYIARASVRTGKIQQRFQRGAGALALQ